MYLASKAGERGIEFARLCAHVPSYEFSAETAVVRRMAMDEDYGAWLELMRRLDVLLGLSMDLSELASQNDSLTMAWNHQIEDLAATLPQHQVHEYLDQVMREFREDDPDSRDDPWESALRNIVGGDD